MTFVFYSYTLMDIHVKKEMIMKHIKMLLLIAMSILSLMSCGGNDDNPVIPDTPPVYTSKTFQQSFSFSSWEGDNQSVVLSNLSTAVGKIEKNAAWLTVEKESYSNGAPSVKLTVTTNDDTKERSTAVTITANNGDKVELTVKQPGRSYGIDDPHNNQSDQPAYSRQQ